MQLDLHLKISDFPNSDSDNYYTPPWVFDSLGLEYDLDVCAPSEPISWIPAKKTYTIIDDGLAQEWAGRVWMNPPYSNPLPWVRKFIENGDGIACIPTSTGKWMMEFWEADTLWAILPPMRFVLSNRVPAKGAMPIRCWLVAMGDDCKKALENSGLGKTRR